MIRVCYLEGRNSISPMGSLKFLLLSMQGVNVLRSLQKWAVVTVFNWDKWLWWRDHAGESLLLQHVVLSHGLRDSWKQVRGTFFDCRGRWACFRWGTYCLIIVILIQVTWKPLVSQDNWLSTRTLWGFLLGGVLDFKHLTTIFHLFHLDVWSFLLDWVDNQMNILILFDLVLPCILKHLSFKLFSALRPWTWPNKL